MQDNFTYKKLMFLLATRKCTTDYERRLEGGCPADVVIDGVVLTSPPLRIKLQKTSHNSPTGRRVRSTLKQAWQNSSLLMLDTKSMGRA